MNHETLLRLTADIVSAHVAHNNVALGDVAGLVERVHQSLAALGQPVETVPEERVPVVSVKASVKPDYIVCLECGKQQKMLKRHLMTAHGETPDEYRKAYGLPAAYPMIAANYSDRRRDIAMQIGLGRKPGRKSRAPAAAVGGEPKASRRSRKPAAGETPSSEAAGGEGA